jgi:hypothetical protein
MLVGGIVSLFKGLDSRVQDGGRAVDRRIDDAMMVLWRASLDNRPRFIAQIQWFSRFFHKHSASAAVSGCRSSGRQMDVFYTPEG